MRVFVPVLCLGDFSSDKIKRTQTHTLNKKKQFSLTQTRKKHRLNKRKRGQTSQNRSLLRWCGVSLVFIFVPFLLYSRALKHLNNGHNSSARLSLNTPVRALPSTREVSGRLEYVCFFLPYKTTNAPCLISLSFRWFPSPQFLRLEASPKQHSTLSYCFSRSLSFFFLIRGVIEESFIRVSECVCVVLAACKW